MGTCRFGACLHRRKTAQNATLPGGFLAATLLPQVLQLLLELSQFHDSRFNMADVFINQVVNGLAIGGGLVHLPEQEPYFFMGHIQSSAVADKTQALQMMNVVKPVIASGALGFGKQMLFLVITNRFDRALCGSSQFTYFHGKSSLLLTL